MSSPMRLFKLKIDRETVGYLKFADRAKGVLFSPTLDGIWIPYESKKTVIFDTAHPFVCKDKTGKDVFEGDKVIGEFEKGGECFNDTATLVWDEEDYGYLLKLDTYVFGRPGYWEIDCEHIELIEEQDNE